MTSNTLFSLDSLENDLKSGIHSSFDSKNISAENIDFWAKSTLKNNIENKIRNSVKNVNAGCCNNYSSPPSDGFRVMFGLQILLDFKVRFKTHLDIGYGKRYGDFSTYSSVHIAAYNDGLGVGVGKNNLTFDVTAAVNLTVGSGYGKPLQSYAINYNSPIPLMNNFKNSISYGQALTWNSNLNQNQFSLDRIQREGLIGFRLGNVNVSSNNDTKRFYKGGGTDMGWTGGIIMSTPYFEMGFQDFTGDYYRTGDTAKTNDEIWKKELKKDGENPFDYYHRQTPYQKNLNKASNFFRLNSASGNNITIDFIGEAWLQDLIHKGISDFRFEYDYKDTQVW